MSPSRLMPATSMPVLLDARGAQACKPMIADRGLPGEEFLNCQRVALARLLKAEKAAANCGHHFSFAPDHPATGVGGGQIGNCQRAPIGADDIFDAGSYHFGHWTLLHTQDLSSRDYRRGFKNWLRARKGFGNFWHRWAGMRRIGPVTHRHLVAQRRRPYKDAVRMDIFATA